MNSLIQLHEKATAILSVIEDADIVINNQKRYTEDSECKRLYPDQFKRATERIDWMKSVKKRLFQYYLNTCARMESMHSKVA